ncbi:hypothetical protein [Streptomyces sp. A012304]|uniref:hypothetical protein n=1 Tax=Streptomyces sp. A012304 TaxID=375446 RepID=UPI0022302EA0|nr:hypothetical protein [Streptomyces sp. A012304]GKQ34551.1 hypothetical protein ALMP_11000 [Streptomyces sp. A012304]
MAASAHLVLPARSKRPAAATADLEEPHIRVFSAEGTCAEAPLTSEPPLPYAEPLTSEPPLAAADPDVTRP